LIYISDFGRRLHLASALCGSATSLTHLVIYRLLQGACGAGLVQNTRIVHSRLIEHLRPDNPLAQAPSLVRPLSLSDPVGVAALNAEVTRQATMVAYVNDFALMMMIVILLIPLLLLVRRPRPVLRADRAG
jgi:hypothetical protein